MSASSNVSTPAKVAKKIGKSLWLSRFTKPLQPQGSKNELCIDSHLIAGQLDINHNKMMSSLVYQYQAYSLLTYSRNTSRARRIKIKLIKVFNRFREAQQAEHDYQTFCHSLHDIAALVVQREHELGSTTAHGFVHSNINNLVNKAFGISSGSRGSLLASMRLKVTHAQFLAADVMEYCLQDGLSHKEIYKEIKGLVFSLAEAGVIRNKRSLVS